MTFAGLSWSALIQVALMDENQLNEQVQRDYERFAAAVASLGLATAGTLFLPALKLGCIPLMAYLTAYAVHDAYKAYSKEARLDLALAESVILGLSLAKAYYLPASLACALYHGGRTLWPLLTAHLADAAPAQQPLARLHRADGEVEVPVGRLQRGDTVIVHAGEMIPVNGVITQGQAWIAPPGESHQTALQIKRPQALVYAAQLVLAGSIHVAVQPAGQ